MSGPRYIVERVEDDDDDDDTPEEQPEPSPDPYYLLARGIYRLFTGR